jgi:cytochrome c
VVANQAQDLNLSVPTISVALTDKNEFEKEEVGKDYPGLATTVYKVFSMADVYDSPKTSNPVLTGVAPAVHFTSGFLETLEGLDELVFFQYQGYLTIEEGGNYVFRLVSDDGARLYIDNKEIVNNDGDHGAQAADGEIILKKESTLCEWIIIITGADTPFHFNGLSMVIINSLLYPIVY